MQAQPANGELQIPSEPEQELHVGTNPACAVQEAAAVVTVDETNTMLVNSSLTGAVGLAEMGSKVCGA